MSAEIDILPLGDDADEVARLADLIEGVAGEWSPFEERHGFSIDGVDRETAVLPDGWRDRLVRVQNVNTAPPIGGPQYTGWCLDKEDLCVAKLCAFREKDQNFVAALLEARLVDAEVIARRLPWCRSSISRRLSAHSPGLRPEGERSTKLDLAPRSSLGSVVGKRPQTRLDEGTVLEGPVEVTMISSGAEPLPDLTVNDHVEIVELARRQGVEPISSVDELVFPGTFKSDEELDEFLADLYSSRRNQVW